MFVSSKIILIASGLIPHADPVIAPTDSGAGPAALRAVLERAYAGRQPPEAVRMLTTIAGGGRMSAASGWFGPAQTRYTFAWLARAHGLDGADGITREQFRGRPEWFAQLDRDRDGRITAADLDWSEQSPYQVQTALVTRLFRRMNAAGDGKLTEAEWVAFFRAASKGKDGLSADELRDLLLAAPGGGGKRGGRGGPSAELLVRGLFRNEVGAMQEGPAVDAAAPDFVLQTHDGKERLHLIDPEAGRPTVLVFGSFT